MFSLAPLLLQSEGVPAEARAALQAALFGAPEQRAQKLESAARVLFRETDLDCGEVRDLVGLQAGCCG